MALYRGGLEPSAIYRGNQPVSAVYQGDTKVWSADIRSGAQIWMPLDPPGRPLLEHAGTLSPAVPTSTLQARDGYGYTAAGAGPGATMPYAGTWDTGGTVSMWVRQTGQTSGGHAAFYRKSGNTEVAMWHQVGGSPPHMLFSLIMSGTVVDLFDTSVAVPNSEWVMVTITVSRPAGSSSWTVRGYVDGQPVGSVTRSAVAQPIAPGDITFAGTSWGGDVDDLLVWDRALTPEEVAEVRALKAGNPYADADYYYPLTGMSLQNKGVKSTSLTSHEGALADRGNHAWIAKSIPRINVTESWSNGWSASAWFQKTGAHTGGTSGTAYLFSRGSNSKGAAVYIATVESSPNLSWRLDDGSTLLGWVTETNLLPASGWFHFAVTAEYVAPNYKLRFFVNGTMVRSSNLATSLNNLVFAPDDWASFGNVSSGANFPYEGNMDDMAMWPRKLGDDEVVSIYLRGRSN